MQTHQPTASTKKTCKCRPFVKRLMGFEPTTFCMASRTGERGRVHDLPANRQFLPRTARTADVEVEIGQSVVGPERTFATPLAEITVSGRTLRRARALCARILQEPPLVAPAGATVASRTPP
jgi:hypothetical protein